MHRVAAELDRVGDVLQAVACDDGDDRVVRAKDALFAELLDSSRASDAGGLAEDAAGRAEQLLRGHDLLVGHVDDDAVRLADGHERFIGVARHADSDGVGQRVLLHWLPRLIFRDRAVDRVAALGLRGDQAREPVDEANGVEILQALPDARDRAAVADGDGEIVWHVPVELFGNLKRDGLLALGEIRVDGRIAVVPAPLVNGLFRQLERLFIVTLDGDDVCTERHQLRNLALRCALRHEDERAETRGGRIAREGRGGIAG